MRAIVIGLYCWMATLGLVACTNAGVESPDEVRFTEEQAGQIIVAIEKYTQDHSQLPKQLGVLVPAYLHEIPKTTRGQSFEYRLSVVDSYLLCFRYRYPGKCCYIPRLKIWDCSTGTSPE